MSKKASKEVHVHISGEAYNILEQLTLHSNKKKKGSIIEDLLFKANMYQSEIEPISFKELKYSLKRISTGIELLDNALDGGIPTNFMVVVNGEPGTAKTILGLQFLMKAKEKAILFTFEENPEQLAQHGHQFGFDLAEKVKKGKLLVFNLKSICVDDIIDRITTHEAERVVIDSVASRHEEDDHLCSWDRLLAKMKEKDVTCLLITRGNDGKASLFENRSDGVIYMDKALREDEWERSMLIKKMRATPLKKVKIPFIIGTKGIEIKEEIENSP